MEYRFLARRFLNNEMIVLDNATDLGSLIEAVLKDKAVDDMITFGVMTKEGRYQVSSTTNEESKDIAPKHSGIPLTLAIKVFPQIDHRMPVEYAANQRGYLWRVDNAVIMEAYDILDDLEKQDESQ